MLNQHYFNVLCLLGVAAFYNIEPDDIHSVIIKCSLDYSEHLIITVVKLLSFISQKKLRRRETS